VAFTESANYRIEKPLILDAVVTKNWCTFGIVQSGILERW